MQELQKANPTYCVPYVYNTFKELDPRGSFKIWDAFIWFQSGMIIWLGRGCISQWQNQEDSLYPALSVQVVFPLKFNVKMMKSTKILHM